MASFSWSDTARAVFGSCLTCLPSAERHRHAADDDDGHRRRRGHGSLRRDELESLLQGADHGDDAEMDVDALSLHSRLGQQDGQRTSSSSSRRKKRTRNNNNRGRITLFGFDLFGRPLRGPASGEDEEQEDNVVGDGEDESSRRISRLSSSTLDSDAAPLAEDAIAELSAQTQAQREAARGKKKKKGAAAARKRMRGEEAGLLVDRRGDAPRGEGFEGFPGGGIGPDDDDFGTFQQAHYDGGPLPPPPGDDVDGDVDGDDARADFDFDAGSYVRGAAGPRSDSGSGTTRTRSRSASASNTSSSDPAARVHGIRTVPRYAGPVSPAVPSSSSKLKPKRLKKSGKRSTTTGTTVSSSASQPRSPTDDAVHAPRIDVASSPTFEGFPEDDDETFEGGGDVASRSLKLKLVTGESGAGASAGGFPSPGLMPGGRFPSAGLGRSSGFPSLGLGERKQPPSMRGQGAFLARMGDDA